MPERSLREETATSSPLRRWGFRLVPGLVLLGLTYGLWNWREARHLRKAIEAIRAEIEGGHYGLAAKALDALLAR